MSNVLPIPPPRGTILDNHWSHSLKHFEWPEPLGTRGVRLETGRLGPQVGPEVIAVIFEATDFANDLKKCSSFQVGTNFGITFIDADPVVFLLWWVAPVVNGIPLPSTRGRVPRSVPQKPQFWKAVEVRPKERKTIKTALWKSSLCPRQPSS